MDKCNISVIIIMHCYYACRWGHTDIVRYLCLRKLIGDRSETTSVLEESGVDLNPANILHLAIMYVSHGDLYFGINRFTSDRSVSCTCIQG